MTTPQSAPPGLIPCDDNHEWGLTYDAKKDVLFCQVCGHEQHEEMGG